MAKKNPKRLPLSEALNAFTKEITAPEELLNYKEVLENISNEEDPISRFFDGLSKASKLYLSYNNFQNQKKELLLKKIRERKLFAYGRRTLPTIGRYVERIDSDLFRSPIINFSSSTVENAGHRFEIVEIERAKQNYIEVEPRDIQPGPYGPGRPSKAIFIEEAIEALTNRGVDISRLPRKTAYNMVRDQIEKSGVNIDIGFSNTVIQKIIYRKYGRRK